MNTEKWKQDAEELEKHLKEQVYFLQSSAQRFDQGLVSEARRMATTIRVLVHDTENSISLLKQCNKKKIQFYDTASEYDSSNRLTHHGLVALRKGRDSDDSGYVAMLDNLPPPRLKWCDFDRWWNRIVFADYNKRTMSRRELVLAVANTDGGAHVDPHLPAKYAALSRSNSMQWFWYDGSQSYPIPNVELVSIRQIAHEVLVSLQTGMDKA